MNNMLSAIVLSILTFFGMNCAQGDDAQAFLDFGASDPIVLGWMVGSLPPSDKIIRFEDGTFRHFPESR